MAQNIQTFSVTAPGFFGLNTQDSSLDLEQGWSLVANNAVIDKFGRIGARKGWLPQNTASGPLGSAAIRTIAEHVDDAGNVFTLVFGNNKVFKLTGGALVELTYGGGGTAPTITGDNWSVSNMGGAAFAFQRGHDPIVFDSIVSASTYKRISEMAGYNGTVQQANFSMSAWGRIWNVDTTTEKGLIQYSDIRHPEHYNTGSSGTLNVDTVWPNGNDTITALAAHNDFLFIFGTQNILVYSGASSIADPSPTFRLSDTVTGIGCIARDSVQNTGSDVIFLSKTGVRSVLRTIQEKSAPFRDLSKNVRDDLMRTLDGTDLSLVKSVYSPLEAFYLLTVPITNQVYCFDTKQPLQDGSARITTWDSITPTCFCSLRDGSLLIGKAGYVGKYTGYFDNTTTYRFQYFTNHADLGQPSITTVLKKLSIVVIGGSLQYVTIKWGYDFSSNYQAQNVQIPAQGESFYGVSEYGIAKYSDGVALQTLVAYPTSSGKIVQTGYESDIQGFPLSIQKLEIQAKNGKIV
jgi:hypothetical protein